MELAFRYYYRQLEKDALIAAFNNSAFRTGGTDVKGHEFGLDLIVLENTTLGLSYFLTTVGFSGAFNFHRVFGDITVRL